MKPCFDELEAFLTSLKGTRFIYIPNPGNAGDSLIAHATYQIFERLGLAFEIGNELAIYPNRVVVWGGGGNFIRLYANLNNFLLNNLSVADRVVVLPQTVRAYESTLAKLGPNCDVFCRDRMSYEHVKQHAPQASAYLSHDLAFTTDLEATRKATLPFSVRMIRRNGKRFLRTVHARTHPALDSFRADAERTAIAIPATNADISAIFATGVMTPADTLETSCRLARFVNGFKTVNTNRLHVGILAAMLGKTVNLYDNSYGKNRAVYEHSLREFANVIWHG